MRQEHWRCIMRTILLGSYCDAPVLRRFAPSFCAQVKVTLLQEDTLLFGEIEIVSGSFPPAQKTISIRGSISNDGTSDSYSIQAIDTADTTVTSFSFSLTA